MKLSRRAEIRHYIINMLKDRVDVGERVFSSRPTSPLFLNELPSVCVFFPNEDNEIWSGSAARVKEYQRKLSIGVAIAVEDIVDPDEDINTSLKGEDYLDFLSMQAEDALSFDATLARRLPDFDPNTNIEGLAAGSVINGITPYDAETTSERRVLGQGIRIDYEYITPAYFDVRLYDFLEYYAALIRVGATASTVDPVLLAAEGEIADED